MMGTGIDAPVQSRLNLNFVRQNGWNPQSEDGEGVYKLNIYVVKSRQRQYISDFNLIFQLWMCEIIEISNQTYTYFIPKYDCMIKLIRQYLYVTPLMP